jgi:hypothetical protein
MGVGEVDPVGIDQIVGAQPLRIDDVTHESMITHVNVQEIGRSPPPRRALPPG